VTGIVNVVRNGVPWRALPHDVPTWHRGDYHCRVGCATGAWEAITDGLRTNVRAAAGTDAEPSAAIIASQSVQRTAIPGERGDAAGKQVNGRKRSVIVDTMGLLLRVVVPAADILDLQGGQWGAMRVPEMKQRITNLWGDPHYGGPVAEWAKERCGWDGAVVSRPSDAAGFVVLPRRGVGERPFGWLPWCRRLSNAYEQLVEVSAALVDVAMVPLMLRRLKPSATC